MIPIFEAPNALSEGKTALLGEKIATCLQKPPYPIAFLIGNGCKGKLAAEAAKRVPQAVLYGENQPNSLSDFRAEEQVVLDGLDEWSEAVVVANRARGKRISVHIPCGMDDLGVSGSAFSADETLVCRGLSYAHLLNDACDVCGELTVLEEGEGRLVAYLFTDQDFALPHRKRNTHKGNYGKIAVLGGSERFPSAPLFTASAALRCGAGLVTLYAPKAYATFYAAHADRGYTLDFIGKKEQPVFDLDAVSRIAQADVIVMGMGMGNNETTKQYVSYFLRSYQGTLVLDADALNVLADNLDLLQNHLPSLILTPHVGEYCRLSQRKEVLPQEVKEFAARYGVTLAVKSCSSVISDGNEIWIANSGTPALARGGSGDSLAGIVAAFAAVAPALTATSAACHLFGRAGEESERVAGNALSPSPLETIDCIPRCLSAFTKRNTY